MATYIPEELGKLMSALKGLTCWDVSYGGAAGSTFQLALGEKVHLLLPPETTKHSDTIPRFEGEASILVWCAWRLDTPDDTLTSWDDTNESIEAGLTRLIGARLESVEVFPPAWDMNIEFSNRLYLHVFCDHVPGDPSFDGNWDVRIKNTIITAGPGARYVVEERPCMNK